MESPFPSRAELDPPEQTPHVCLLACSPHPDGSTDAAARLLESGPFVARRDRGPHQAEGIRDPSLHRLRLLFRTPGALRL